MWQGSTINITIIDITINIIVNKYYQAFETVEREGFYGLRYDIVSPEEQLEFKNNLNERREESKKLDRM